MVNQFISDLYKSKLVSVWGVGYLGYTTAIKLQSKGFAPIIFDSDRDRLDGIKNGTYPGASQENSWTIGEAIPKLDLNRCVITNNINELFDANIHIIAFSLLASDSNKTVESIVKNLRLNGKNNLFLFQSAEIPGAIDNFFVKKMDGLNNAFCASIFRSDWLIEEFVTDKKRRAIGVNDKEVYALVNNFLKIFDIDYFKIDSIELAEIYANATKSLQYICSSYLSQLSISYPSSNINSIAHPLLNSLEHNESLLTVGSIGYRTSNSNDNLLLATVDNEKMTILQESQKTNLSILMHYVDLLKRNNIDSVLIMGLSSQKNQKDLRASPSIVLIRYLISNNIKTYVVDPFFSEDEILNISTDIISSDIHANVEAVFCMIAHNEFQFLTQDVINSSSLFNAKIVIDNARILNNITLSDNTIFHVPGDGNLF
jgi:UDP-N-acetyl-D-mannosaminuronate dehydrogenase